MTVGVDVADIARVRALLARYERAEERIFTAGERAYCRGFKDPATHFAGTLAAKEAVLKAMGLGPVLPWARCIEIVRREAGRPVARVMTGLGVEDVAISISHDADVAVAVALSSSALPVAKRTPADRHSRQIHSGTPKPNPSLKGFLGTQCFEDKTAPCLALLSVAECSFGSDFP